MCQLSTLHFSDFNCILAIGLIWLSGPGCETIIIKHRLFSFSWSCFAQKCWFSLGTLSLRMRHLVTWSIYRNRHFLFMHYCIWYNARHNLRHFSKYLSFKYNRLLIFILLSLLAWKNKDETLETNNAKRVIQTIFSFLFWFDFKI